jgi:hypothetical protein
LYAAESFTYSQGGLEMAWKQYGTRCGFWAVLTFSLLSFSGCSEHVQSPLSPTDSTGNPFVSPTVPGIFPAGGTYPEESWDNPVDCNVLRTREDAMLSESDVSLVYNPDDIPPGVDPSIYFMDPQVFDFVISPAGVITIQDIRVIIDYSKADLEGVDEQNLQVYGYLDGQYTPIPTTVHMASRTVAFETNSFARYALARD